MSGQPAEHAVDTYHAGVGGSLLGLEEDHVLLAARRAGPVFDARQLERQESASRLKEEQASDE